MSSKQGSFEFSFDQTAQLPHLQYREGLLAVLDAWVERGWLRLLDRAFVGFLYECEPAMDPRVAIGAALASHQLGHGHVCLDLAATLKDPDYALSLPPEGDSGPSVILPSDVLAGLDADSWCAALEASPLVAGRHVADLSSSAQPLVLMEKRLYLRRYWRYEQSIGASLRLRLTESVRDVPGLPEGLTQLFGAPKPEQTDWQKLACALAARGAISIITGGPGTGKTTTVVRLLGLLQTSAIRSGHTLRIRLAAPTGKAAARLSTSIAEQIDKLDVCEEVRANIPADVTTLHRLLGSRPDTRHFRHHARNPLPLDVLVVDEASMIDLEMMACVLDALPNRARLVLIGDKDQLASVEAGAVLGDLCRDAETGRYSEATRDWLQAVSGENLDDPQLLPGDAVRHPLAQQTVMLRVSRRFDHGSGIGQLARCVNQADATAARNILEQSSKENEPDTFNLILRNTHDQALERLLLDGHPGSSRGSPHGYAHYLEILQRQRPSHGLALDDPAWTQWASMVLAAFDDFQLLCALRKGDYGVEGLNLRIGKALHARGLIEHEQGWFEGRPVLVTRNDYSLGLMNGDIGIALKLPQAGVARHDAPMSLRVAFPRNDGGQGVRFILPSRLNAVETVFAMTVHKSQGSEFTHTALLLPDKISPVLTKELVYTGITRAKLWFTLIEAGQGVFEEAVARRVRRISGLTI